METSLVVLALVGFLVFFGGIVFLFYYFNKKTIILRKLKKIPSKKISQFLSGDIGKVVGKVEFIGEPLISPLSNRPCAYYHVYVEQHKGSGKNSSWQKIIEEEVHGKFVIRDGRDSAVVDFTKIKTYLVQDQVFQSGTFNDATTGLEQFLIKRGHSSVNFLGLNKSIRYKEGVLESGEMIAVAGKGEWKEARDLDIPDSYGRILQITQTDKDPVYLSDDPKTLKVTESNASSYTR